VSIKGGEAFSTLTPCAAYSIKSCMKKTTDAQSRYLSAIAGFWCKNGYGPTVRDLCRSLGITSTNGAIDMLHRLERRGLIVWPYSGNGNRLQRALRTVEASNAVRTA